MININNILHNKDVVDKVPPYFKFQDPPIVSYTYSKIIGRKLFNYNRVLKEIDIRNNVHDGTCDCMSSPFCYKPHGHIITGDMNIITNPKLRQLFQFGPKYREPPKVNWNFNFKLIMDAAEAYAKKWAAHEKEVGCLSDRLRTVRDKVKSHISRLRSSHTVINTTSDFDDPSVWECLDALRDKYVVVPADKASNNIIFVCKNYYIQCLVKN